MSADVKHARPSVDTNGYSNHHSAGSDPFVVTPLSTTNMRAQLQTLLDDKEKHLQLAGTLGQRILAQQVELEERINALSEHEHRQSSGTRTPDPEGDPEMRRRLQELAETLQSWETENEQLWSGFGQKLPNGPPSGRPPQTPLTPSASPTRANHQGLPQDEQNGYFSEASTAPQGLSAAQSSRRAKNAQHRETDVKFAYDIGTSLLTEVRRLQSLLNERDGTIKEMIAEKDDLEKANDSLKTNLRHQEGEAEKFKEENWNLEVQIQEARQQLQDAQQTSTRAESEARRTTKQLATAREAVEAQKSENVRMLTQLEEQKSRHETAAAMHNRKLIALAQEKTDLQVSLDAVKTEKVKLENRMKLKYGSPMSGQRGQGDVSTPMNHYEDDDIFATGGVTASKKKLDPGSAYLTPGGAETFDRDFDSSPDPSPSKPSIVLAPNHPSKDNEALKQALEHERRHAKTLQSTVEKLKKQNMALKKHVVAGPGGMPGGWEEDEEEVEEAEEPKSPRGFGGPVRSGRGINRPTRGRSSKIMSLTQKLGLASVDRQLAAAQYDDEEYGGSPTSPPANRALANEEVEGEEPSPFVVPSRPTSVDGMDPAFANVLKNLDGSPARGASPLVTHEPISPSADRLAVAVPRKTRGGFGFVPESRPDSMVGANASSLGAELSGFGDVSGDTTAIPTLAVLADMEAENATPVKVMAEMCMQTDPEEVPVAPAPPAPVVVEKAECSIQTDVEVVRVVSYSEGSIATDPEPIIPPPPMKVTVDMDIQTDEMESDLRPVEIQTGPQAPIRDVEIRSMVISREEVEHPDLAVPFPRRSSTLDGSMTTDDETIPSRTPRVLSMASVRTPRPVAMIFEDEDEGSQHGHEHEHGMETETDGEFVDAKESLNTRTPMDSVSDFHSALGGRSSMENGEYSDAESTQTSRMAVREKYASLSTHGRRMAHSRGASDDVPPMPVLLSRVELREQSIQTDEWSPPPQFLVPPSPAKSFHRVGAISNAPPFQFISSPPRNSDLSFASAGTITPTQPGLAPGARTPMRESAATFGVAAGLVGAAMLASRSSSRADRRMSIESAISQSGAGHADENGMQHSGRTPNTPVLPIDRSKPPVMIAPPPPSMPPPAIIPVNKRTLGAGVPPPRPTSPPPPELIHRATTPTFQRSTTPSLHVPTLGRASSRQHGASLPPNAQGLRQPVSNGSFRSAPHNGMRSPIAGMFDTIANGRRDPSSTSLLSAGSRRLSVSSSRSSELHVHHAPTQLRSPARPSAAPSNSVTLASRAPDDGTDVDVIHAITQAMIGEYLYKYTRRVVGKGHGEKRHRRFFWVHPYTRTLYWSSSDPGGAATAESSAKSSYIESVKSIMDPNPLPLGVHQYSIVVATPQREIKFTAPTKERHDIWYRALQYLLERPATVDADSPDRVGDGRPSASPRQRKFSEDNGMMMASPRSVRSVHSTHSYSITPRAMRSQTQLSTQSSTGKRPGTPAAEYLRWAEGAQKSPTRSIHSFRHGHSHTMDDDDEDYDNVEGAEETFELNQGDEGFEAMENVRACCDGEHDLGALSRRPGQPPRGHHHHHHHPTQSRPQTPAERPTSPSAWSFRSRAGSTVSEGGSRLSQWAGDAKRSIRFKSGRGTSPAPRPSLPVPRSNN